jgi:hypothetical protein
MGIGDVEDVDVVADAGAVGRRVIGTEDFEMRNDAEGGVENFGDEMSFDAMGFAAFCGSAGGVEIAKSGVMKAGIGAIVGKEFLEAKFGFAVGVDGIFGVVFGDGDGVRFAVSGSGRRENEFFYAVASYSVEEIDAAGDICGIKGAGFADRFGNEGFASKMHDGIDLMLGENFLNLRADAEIGFAEDGAGRNGGGVAFLKIIESDDLVAASEENFGTDAADVACGSGDKNVQGSNLSFFAKIELCSRAAALSGQQLKVSG